MDPDYGFCHLLRFVTDHNSPLCPNIKYSCMGDSLCRLTINNSKSVGVLMCITDISTC